MSQDMERYAPRPSLTDQLLDFANRVYTRDPFDPFLRTWLTDRERELVYVRTGIRDIGPVLGVTIGEGAWTPNQQYIATLEAVSFENPRSVDDVPLTSVLDFAEEVLSAGIWEGFGFDATKEPEIGRWCAEHDW
jgi:hypothetical protein